MSLSMHLTLGAALLVVAASFSAPSSSDWVDIHNKHRRDQRASDMQEMVWSSDLAALADRWARKCHWGHRPSQQRRNVGGFRLVGENLYAGTRQPTAASVLKPWMDEKVDYRLADNSCAPGKVCGHYTQVVWAKSCAVGCSVAFCPAFKIFGRDAYLTVCNYGEAGNFNHRKPFKRGSGGLIASSCSGKGPRITKPVKKVTKKHHYKKTTSTPTKQVTVSYEEYLKCYNNCKSEGITSANYHKVVGCMRSCWTKKWRY